MEAHVIVTEQRGRVGLIKLNRPDALNALNSALVSQLVQAVHAFDQNPAIACLVLSGGAKAFAAGADIKDARVQSFPATYLDDFFVSLEQIAACRKPIVAAVAGYALGGGFELALMADVIVAAENVVFGLPEVAIGVMPGAGGTQRLTRAVGKALAMDMILTGRRIGAVEAAQFGLVSRVVPLANLDDTALDLATKIAGYSRPVTTMAKESVNRAFETSLAEGLRFERRLFHAMFALEDQSEGMSAFEQKRAARFSDR